MKVVLRLLSWWNRRRFRYYQKAVEIRYTFGDEIMIALDCAAEFYVDGNNDYSKFEGENGKIRSSAEQVEYLAELAAKYQSSLMKMVWMKMTGMDGKC
jgi:enolase